MGVFDNPANADLLELLEAEAEPTMSHDLDGYELHALPEVCDRLISLAGELPQLPQGWYAAYGVPVLAADNGVIYAFAIGVDGHVQMAVYFDAERDLETARGMWRSLDETEVA